MYAREWKCKVPLNHQDGFIAYLHETGIREASATPGYQGAQILFRERQGMAEITLITYWDTMTSIEAFAGEEIDKARLYPEDHQYHLEPDLSVNHYEVSQLYFGVDISTALSPAHPDGRGSAAPLMPTFAGGYMHEQNDMTSACQYDEMIPAGRDFRSREVVEAYDAYHRRFRDVEQENAAIIAALGLQASHTIADFGSGTGAFALQAARHCARVHAIDVSQAMLDYTAWKAHSAGVNNVICHHGGFLTYVHTDALLDTITSSMALHHLPDFWKQKALLRLHAMLKPGGKLFLADVVFSENDYEANITQWIQVMTAKAGTDMAADLKSHLCTEFSTFTWIMEGLLARAGFHIDQAEHESGVLAKYLCTKIA